MVKEFCRVSGHERTGTGSLFRRFGFRELGHFKFSNRERHSLNKDTYNTYNILTPSHHSVVNDPNIVII